MFKKMHVYLTFFCTLITGLILVTMTCICLNITESGMRTRNDATFQDNLNTMLAHFESQTMISSQWLLQMEANYHVRLHVLDNDTPLFSEQLRDNSQYEPLFQQALEQAKTDLSFDYKKFSNSNVLTKHVNFKMHGSDSQNYYSSVALIPKQNGYLTVVTLYSLRNMEHDIWNQRFLFGIVDAAAILLLAVFSWIFTGKLIRPIRESRERQVQFIAAASHELRSPLTVILTSLSAMKVADKEQTDAFADTIQSEGQRMSRLIGDMLTLANADNRTWSIHPSSIEPDTLLLQTYEKYEPVARSKGFTLNISLPDELPPPCECDGERIAQVLSILIDNAFSYTSEGGKVRLSMVYESSRIRFLVSDNGPGVPESCKRTIFERFYRHDSSHKDKDHFGLGLCIAREIIKLHKGKIWVEDTPGGGATFAVQLPLS